MGIQVFLYLFLTVCWSTVESKPSPKDWDDGGEAYYSSENLNIGEVKRKQIARYLSNYGYTETYTENKHELKESIKDFQYFAGLLVTGELDSTTINLMEKNRCGVKDPYVREKREGRAGRVRRFNPQGTKWKKEKLTWQYEHNEDGNNAWRPDNPRGLTEDNVRYIMKKAMGLWEKQTNIEFVENRTTSEPDIWIKFGTRHHGDPFAFDGSGGTLAHAFYPHNNKGLSGDVHFDDDETFTINDNTGYGRDLMWVATHELGHTLGLDHSSDRDAVMYPFYMGYKSNFDLKYDDIAGIQSIYGGKIQKPKPDKQIPAHEICPSSKVTAVWDYKRGGSYIMITQEERLYTVSKNDKGIIHPNIKVSDYYRMPYAIDAVFQSNLGKNNNILYDIIFTSQGYYIYNGFRKVSGPHTYKSRKYSNETCTHNKPDINSPLKLDFPEWVRVDAVMKWWRNNKVYFFAGDKYWRYNETKKMLDCGYPRVITDGWKELPATIDSAYSSSDRKETYFTKGDDIYRINDSSIRLKAGYPKSIKEDLLHCKDVNV